MLYKILNILFKLSQFFYFKSVEIVGVEKIPQNEANLLIANHPSAFKDPILIGVNLKIPIYFLAAEEFMGGKRMASFLGNNFNMIPIYRPSIRPGESHKNSDSFEKCYNALNDKKNILIFAEGHSETQSWLDPLKTGTARIALEALVKNSDLDKINIIPIGLNYSNPHQFRSKFLIKIGTVVEVKKNDELDKNVLTSVASEALREAMNGVPKEESEWQDLILKIIQKKNKEKNFYIEYLNDKKVIEVLNENLLEKHEELKNATLELKNRLIKENIELDDYLEIKNPLKRKYVFRFLLLLLSFPGFALNFIPYYLVKSFVKNKDFKYSFEGSMYFAFGTLFFILWHIIIVVTSYFFVGLISVLLPVFLVFFGYLTLIGRDYLLPFYLNRSLIKNIQVSSEVENSYLNLLERLKSIRIM